MITYDTPFRMSYTIPAAAIDTAAVLLSVCGPAGLKGRVSNISGVVTTSTTVAASEIQVGTTADEDAYATCAVPVLTAPAVFNTLVDLTSDANLIPANSVVEIASDGGATAGDGDIVVTIDWF